MSMKKEEKRAAFSLAPWKRLWQSIRQHRVRLTRGHRQQPSARRGGFLHPAAAKQSRRSIHSGRHDGGLRRHTQRKYIGVCAFEIIMLFIYFKACMGLEMLSGRDMKEACFVNLQRLSLDYYNVTSAGHMLSRVMSDTDRIASCLAWVFPDILWGFAYIFGVLGVMLSLSPSLAMTIIVIAPIVTALTVYFQKKLIVLNREVRAQHSKITSSYNEGIMGAKTSKTLALESRLTDEFEQTTANAARAGILHGRMRAIYVPLIVLCGTLAASATLLRGGSMVFKGTLSIGVLSAFMTYALSLFQTFRQQAARISQLISLQANVERVVDLIDEKPTVQDSPEVEAKYGDCFHPKMENWEEMRGEIDFDDVSFTLSGRRRRGAARTSRCTCPRAARSPSSARRARARARWSTSSAASLSRRRAACSSTGATRASAASFGCTATSAMCCNRRTCSPARFVKTSAMASPTRRTKRSMRRLRRSARTASRPSSNRAMTRTWASAATNSPRAKNSCISFARAVIAKPKIFVLDEATSSVDTETEMLIQKATHTLMQGTTSFVIAHRLSTIRQADVILVIDHGKIVEQGTHESLLKANGAYAALYHTQLSRQDS